ncbi:MAG: PEP-CTERM sorting domain-containing protein [Deltaproteobacteria bacterium]|nr:PEP-CTERM sorting domain-containing protein [Deltaproteobacteria bacterium]
MLGCRSIRPLLAMLITLSLAGAAAAAPIITTFALYSSGPVTDSDGPQAGGALSSQVTTSDGASRCNIAGSGCSTGQPSDAFAFAAQNETALGIFSALQADGTFFNGDPGPLSLLSRTTWTDSPATAGPNSITLIIKPGELTLLDYASVQFGNDTMARYRIELAVNGSVVFFSAAELRGGASGITLTKSGVDLGSTGFSESNNVAGYTFNSLITTIDLGILAPTDVVTYTMEVQVSGPGFETGGYARIGDPFDLAGSGSSIAFGTPVPEPAVTLLLALTGAIALWVWRRRARRG